MSAAIAETLLHFAWPMHGRWAVCYEVPGTGVKHAVLDCRTLADALRESRGHNERAAQRLWAAGLSSPEGALGRLQAASEALRGARA